jgi:hypothetical protein
MRGFGDRIIKRMDKDAFLRSLWVRWRSTWQSEVHQVPPMLFDESAIPQKRFQKVIEATIMPTWA